MTKLDIQAHQVRLWWSSVQGVDLDRPALRGLLSTEEQRRAERFRVQGAGRRFVAARAMLRLILGRLSGAEPNRLTFAYGDHGKPRLTSGFPHFSLTHSGDTVVVAIAAEALGVDVEEPRELANAARLARRICTPGELETLGSVPAQDCGTRLLGFWTAKEAVLKALGTGITTGMRSVEVEVNSESRPMAVRVRGAPGAWTVLPVDLPVNAVCTVAARGTGWRLEVTEFSWEAC